MLYDTSPWLPLSLTIKRKKIKTIKNFRLNNLITSVNVLAALICICEEIWWVILSNIILVQHLASLSVHFRRKQEPGWYFPFPAESRSYCEKLPSGRVPSVESRGAHQEMPVKGGVDNFKIDCAMKQTLFSETVSTE